MRQEFLKRIISSFVLISIIIFFIIKGSIFLNLFILCCFLVSLYEWHMMKKNNIQIDDKNELFFNDRKKKFEYNDNRFKNHCYCL